MEILEEIFGIYTVSLYKEGKRLIELKALAILIKIIKSTRKAAFLCSIVIFFVVMLACGITVTLVQLINLFQKTEIFEFDLIVCLGLGLSAISIFALSLVWKEDRWFSIFQLDKRIQSQIRAAEGLGNRDAQSYNHSWNKETLESFVGSLVEQKLNEMVKSQKKNIEKKVETDASSKADEFLEL